MCKAADQWSAPTRGRGFRVRIPQSPSQAPVTAPFRQGGHCGLPPPAAPTAEAGDDSLRQPPRGGSAAATSLKEGGFGRAVGDTWFSGEKVWCTKAVQSGENMVYFTAKKYGKK